MFKLSCKLVIMRTLFFCFLLLAFSCRSTKNIPVTYEANGADMITLQRTGCYGTCPIYEVSIFGNGIVSYEGKGFTAHQGKHVGVIEESKVKALFAQMNKLDWENYPDIYPIDNVDFPQFFLKYHTVQTDKVIKANTQAAAELLALSKEIDALVKSIQLKKQ